MNTELFGLLLPWIERLSWTLLHFLWQGTAVALVLAVARRCRSNASSRVQYALSLGALILAGLAPAVTWCALGPAELQAVPGPVTAASAGTAAAELEPETVTKTSARPSANSGSAVLPETGTLLNASSGPTPQVFRVRPALPWLVPAWALGVLFLVCRRTVGWWQLTRLRQSSSDRVSSLLLAAFERLRSRLGLSDRVGLRLSSELAGPIAVGVLKPLVILPASLVAGMPPHQLEALIAHELAHIRRHDTAVNLLQIILETLLFYHPAVWWISRLVREDREACVDDEVLRVCPDRTGYAQALASLAESVQGSALAPAAADRPLLRRIRRILGKPGDVRAHNGLWPGLLISSLLLAVGWFSLRTVASAESLVIDVAPGQSLEQAIEAAPTGATVRLPAGVFSGNLEISKPLTLQGAGWEKTTLRAAKSITTSTESDLEGFAKEARAAANPGEVARIRSAWRKKLGAPTLTVQGTGNVIIRGIQFATEAPPGRVDGLLSEPVVRFSACTNVLMADCAVLGPFWDGIHVLDASIVTIQGTLVGGMWNTGVVVEGRRGDKDPSQAAIRDSEIRNCYHRGITTGSDKTLVSRCRVSGSAWHGIRYDGASPTIEHCLIYNNARSGIYASGETAAKVIGNVFVGNEMNGMSCWFANQDRIEGNTFANNLPEGIAVLGKSKPQLTRNIFFGHLVAISCGMVAGEAGGVAGAPTLEANLFWKNTTDYESGPAKGSPPGEGHLYVDPMFVNHFQRDFRLRPGSPAIEANIGVQSAVPLATPTWALTPGELSMIPTSETRDSEAWRKPGKAKVPVRAPQTRAVDDTQALIEEAFRIDSLPARDQAIVEIARRIQEKDTATVLSGLRALGAIAAVEFDRAPMRAPVRGLLTSPDDQIRAAAVGVIATLNPEPADLDQVLSMVGDSSPQVRQAAPGSIVEMSNKDLTGKVGKAMVTLLSDTEPAVKRNALVVIWGARISPELEHRLIEMSRQKETEYDTLYFGLSTLPEKSESVVDRLIEYLPHRDVFNVAGRALWGLGYGVPESLSPKVAKAALQLLQARADPRTRRECLDLLGKYGTTAELPPLRALGGQPAISASLKTNLLQAIQAIEGRVDKH